MVPNVYAMSQHADGGFFTTKPYFSGSSYILKMSHYKTGPWCEIWDGLHWRWIWNHADELSQDPRWAMMCSVAEKMESAKRESHLRSAKKFFGRIGRAECYACLPFALTTKSINGEGAFGKGNLLFGQRCVLAKVEKEIVSYSFS